jgi:hypothetical protein
MPETLAGVNPSLSTDIVYVSGASVRNAKCPEPSVFVVADCDGDVAVTEASATGLPLDVSVTVPLTAPVVPASAHVTWLSIATSAIAAIDGMKSHRFICVILSLYLRVRVASCVATRTHYHSMTPDESTVKSLVFALTMAVLTYHDTLMPPRRHAVITM